MERYTQEAHRALPLSPGARGRNCRVRSFSFEKLTLVLGGLSLPATLILICDKGSALGERPAFTFFEQRFQLGDGFKIARPSGCTFDFDQALEAETTAGGSKHGDGDRVREQVFVATSRRNLAEQGKGFEFGRQRNMQTALDRFDIKLKGYNYGWTTDRPSTSSNGS